MDDGEARTDAFGEPAPRLDGYEDPAPIAKGGMAVVWRARQISLDRWVAIKVLSPEHCADDADIDRFQSEARTAAKLNHPGIVPVYDAFYRNDRFCLVMAFVDGYTVGAWLKNRGYLAQDECLFVAAGVAEALAYAWNQQQLIHCDIKPENIMVDIDGSIKITDFGLSRSFSSLQGRNNAEGFVFGTPAYIAPEQAVGEDSLSIQADMYALGASLYHMSTGARLFADRSSEAAMEAQVRLQDADPFMRNTSLSPFFCDFIERLLCKKPEHRYASWEHVIEEIHTLRKNLPLAYGEINPAMEKSTVARTKNRDDARAARLHALGIHTRVVKKTDPTPAKTGLPGLPLHARLRTAGAEAPSKPPAHVRGPDWRAMWTEIRRRTRFLLRPDRLGAIGAVVLLLIVTLATTSIIRSRQQQRATAARAELQDIDAWMRNHPHDYKTAIIRCNRLIAALKSNAHAEIRHVARDKRKHLENEQRHAIERTIRNIRDEITPLIEARQFMRAATIVANYDGPMAEATLPTRQELATLLTERANQAARNRSSSAATD